MAGTPPRASCQSDVMKRAVSRRFLVTRHPHPLCLLQFSASCSGKQISRPQSITAWIDGRSRSSCPVYARFMRASCMFEFPVGVYAFPQGPEIVARIAKIRKKNGAGKAFEINVISRFLLRSTFELRHAIEQYFCIDVHRSWMCVLVRRHQ